MILMILLLEPGTLTKMVSSAKTTSGQHLTMLSEVGGPCNYDNMIKMFAAKMAGGVNDPDDLVVDAFKAFDEEVEEKIKGQIVKRHVLNKDDFLHVLSAF